MRALTEQQIDVLFDNPHRTWDIAYGEDQKQHEDGEEEDEESIQTLLVEPLREECWLDKSWAILRFLMLKAAGQPDRGDREDYSSELLFGLPIGTPADYCGPLLREVDETQAFADFLRPLTSDQLLSHFDWAEMRKADVYLVWNENADEGEQLDLREYAGDHFLGLRQYVLDAAASGCGLLIWVS